MNKRELFKIISSAIASGCAGSVVSVVLKNIIPTNISKLQKIGVGIGGFILSDYISSKIYSYSQTQLKEFFTLIDNTKERIEIEDAEVKVIEDDKEA